jgi:hypothetical protein
MNGYNDHHYHHHRQLTWSISSSAMPPLPSGSICVLLRISITDIISWFSPTHGSSGSGTLPASTSWCEYRCRCWASDKRESMSHDIPIITLFLSRTYRRTAHTRWTPLGGGSPWRCWWPWTCWCGRMCSRRHTRHSSMIDSHHHMITMLHVLYMSWCDESSYLGQVISTLVSMYVISLLLIVSLLYGLFHEIALGTLMTTTIIQVDRVPRR